MWSVKNRPYAIQRNANSRAAAFGNLGSQRDQQGFNVSPFDRRRNRTLKIASNVLRCWLFNKDNDTAIRYHGKRFFANNERMQPYERGRMSITGLRFLMRKVIETGRRLLVVG